MIMYIDDGFRRFNKPEVCGVDEQVSMFLSVLALHKKHSVVKFDYKGSGQTMSRYIHLVLKAIWKLNNLFLVTPTPMPNDSGCLGALDGIYIDLQVSPGEKGRYRTRKGRVSTNVLGVCDMEMQFVYVLPGWEGSAADSKILRDVVSRPHGLKVPKGNYYLCGNGYTNSKDFLSPYRERAFSVLKMSFGILRSPSYYPIKTQVRLIIMACFLLHNFIRREMPYDPIEKEHDRLARAYYYRREPEYDMMKVLFKKTKPPTIPRPPEVIEISDDTQSNGGMANIRVGSIVVIFYDSEEVVSPRQSNRYATARRLFDKISSPSPDQPPARAKSSARPSLPPQNFPIPKPSFCPSSNKTASPGSQASQASSSPIKWFCFSENKD
ncbi:hypothetical protein ACS0TY_018183 [Phlomoides rotata]